MTRYVKRILDIRQTIERSLDERDAPLVAGGFRIVCDDGSVIEQDVAALNAIGATRIVASRDILTGEWNVEEDGIPPSLFNAADGTTVEVA